MSLIVPDASEVDMLKAILNTPLTLRLYSNNYTPVAASIAASFTEVAGGGYTNRPLLYAGWAFTAGAPSYALAALESWTYTGPVNAPGTVYGYYVTRDSDGKLMWAERFPAAVLPFTPIAGSTTKITPKFTGSSVF